MFPSHLIESIVVQPRCYKSVGDLTFRTNLQNMIDKMLAIGDTMEVDALGNIKVAIGDTPKQVLFVAHTDTVDSPSTTKRKEVEVSTKGIMSLKNAPQNPVKKPRPAKKTSKKTNSFQDPNKFRTPVSQPVEHPPCCLGADDAVGIAIMLCLIHERKSGTYIFTVGEEKGCIGAKDIVANRPEWLDGFKICIEVDRKGTDEIIIEQTNGKGASYAFATALASALNMTHKPSENGVYTDNAHFNVFIPECVNISAGYFDQHTQRETVDLFYIDELFNALLNVDWGTLPIARQPSDTESYTPKQYFGYDSSYFYDRRDSYGYGYGSARYKSLSNEELYTPLERIEIDKQAQYESMYRRELAINDVDTLNNSMYQICAKCPAKVAMFLVEMGYIARELLDD